MKPALGPNREGCFWTFRIVHFIEKYWIVLCIGLVAIASCRIVSTYDSLSLTADEPYHLACGMQYVANHTYNYDPQNPPLSRAVQALGPYLIGVRPVGLSDGPMEGLAILNHARNFDRTVFLMRLGNLPFFLLACLAVAAWSYHSFGRMLAVVSTGLFTLLPTVLTDSGLGTTDMALGATVAVAFVSAIFWAETPTVPRSLLFGFCTALALLSKATALGYVPATIGLTLIAYWSVRRPSWQEVRQLATERAATFALACTVTVVLMWAAYGFTFGIVPGKSYSLPAPQFFVGLQGVFTHVKNGHAAFLLGESRTTGWWYYYPVALLVKTPIPFLLLSLLGVIVSVRQRARPELLFPLAFCAGILLPAMNSSIDIGIRHIEPIYIGLSVVAAVGLLRLASWARSSVGFGVAGFALVAWMTVSVAIYHPDYLTYFNAFAGKHPENILVDSNYDWGQDLKLLARHFHQLGVTEFTMSSISGDRGFGYLENWYGLPKMNVLDPITPSPGWNVVRPTIDKSYRSTVLHGLSGVIPWYDRIPPTERVGSLILFYIPPQNESQETKSSPQSPVVHQN